MKKLFLIASMATALSGLSVSAQGYFLFTGGPGSVRDPWSGGGGHTSTTNRVAFLWGTGVPLVDAIMTSVPTNGIAYYSYAEAWNLILTDPNFHLALNNTDGSLASALVNANGAWSYASSGTFPVTGTSPGTYQVYVIAWFPSWYDPAMAAAAGAPVGWSAPFTYNAVNQIGTPLSFAASGFQPFAIGTPEPNVFSFLAIGAGALLLRRKR